MADKEEVIEETGEGGGSPDPAKEAELPPEESEETPETELRKAREEAQTAADRLLRLSAEFENYKKRTSRSMDEFRKFANESLVKQLLTVVDNLERAIASSSEGESGLMEGVDMTLKEILKILETFHVKPIDADGQPFDPNFHQAVMQEETDQCSENTVMKVLQKGYLLHDRLIRPAMVVVSKAMPEAAPEGS